MQRTDAGVERDAGAEHDAGVDSGARADAGPCVYGFEPVYSACLAAAPLTLDVPLTRQDTADGARGDCAQYASGSGGRNRYYTLTAPAGQYTRVTVAPLDPAADAVVRVLSDCYATKPETGGRGGDISEGRAVACIRNDSAEEREVIVAVGRYSGEAGDLTLLFDLSVEIKPLTNGCDGW